MIMLRNIHELQLYAHILYVIGFLIKLLVNILLVANTLLLLMIIIHFDIIFLQGQ